MTDILDNELARKYFGCRAVCTQEHFINVGYSEHGRCMSARILDAMQQPILKGERYLKITILGDILENIAEYDLSPYANYLRLPDAFQKQDSREPDYLCDVCHRMASKHIACEIPHKPTPSPEKCECERGRAQWHGHNEKCAIYKPKDAVEEKIINICDEIARCWINREFVTASFQLRDLVRLARESR